MINEPRKNLEAISAEDRDPAKPAFEFAPLPEPPWTTYFEAFPEGASSSEYRLVPVEKLILTKGPENTPRIENGKGPVERAYGFMADLANGVPGAGKRAPISVQHDTDDTYLVIDGNATTAVARKLGWKELPVHIIKD